MRGYKFSAIPALVIMLLFSGGYAVGAPLITVDENGHGTLDFTGAGGVVTPMPGVLASDPGPGGLSAVLTYNLLGPPALVAGDVLMQDGPGGPILDVVRFNPAGTGGNPAYPASLLFYSDNVDGFDSLADTPGPPRAFYPNTRTILEVGPECCNGAIYTPGLNDPGFVPGFAVTYHFISDAVPEPASLTLLGIGVMGLGAYAWRRRKQGAAPGD